MQKIYCRRDTQRSIDCSFCPSMFPGTVPDLYCHGDCLDLSSLVVLHLSASHDCTVDSPPTPFNRHSRTRSWNTLTASVGATTQPRRQMGIFNTLEPSLSTRKELKTTVGAFGKLKYLGRRIYFYSGRRNPISTWHCVNWLGVTCTRRLSLHLPSVCVSF